MIQFYMQFEPEWGRAPSEYVARHFGRDTSLKSPLLEHDSDCSIFPPPSKHMSSSIAPCLDHIVSNPYSRKKVHVDHMDLFGFRQKHDFDQ